MIKRWLESRLLLAGLETISIVEKCMFLVQNKHFHCSREYDNEGTNGGNSTSE